MLKELAIAAAALATVGGAGFWVLTMPSRLDAATVSALGSDASAGEEVFWAGGCTSCHARPGAEGDAALELAGGLELKTPFGTFVAPNISQHPADGIGGWSAEDFANAMMRGVSPGGRHFYPAFPYTSYARMTPRDAGDLFAFMKTLPAVEGRAAPHALPFPFNVRRGLGLWKLVNLDASPIVAPAAGESEAVARGRYLVEGPGHCGECHTPRDVTGGTDRSRWLAGAVAAEGEGNVPNITPGGGISSWSESDIAEYLKSGFTPEFDSAGGAMAAVVKNTGRLADADRAAIAYYLKSVPARENGYPARGN